jgi:hypothetical protein
MRAGARAGKKLVRSFAGFVEDRYGFPPTAVQQERAARAAAKAAAKAAAADGEEGEVNEEATEKAREIESDDSEMESVVTDNPDVVAFQKNRAPVKRSIEIERDHPDFYRYVERSPLKSTKRIKRVLVFYPDEDEASGGEEEKREVHDAVEERVGGSKTVDHGEIGDH